MITNCLRIQKYVTKRAHTEAQKATEEITYEEDLCECFFYHSYIAPVNDKDNCYIFLANVPKSFPFFQ